MPVPGWVEAIAAALGDALDALAEVGRYVLIAAVVAFGVGRTVAARRKRLAAEAAGRRELLQRLTRVMRRMEPAARARDRDDGQDGT